MPAMAESGSSILVAGPAALAEAAAAWSAAPVLALDTEFVRERTFFQKLGLVQIGDGERIWLVDPLACGDLAPLARVLEQPSVLKVLHSASEDLEVFHHRLGARPAPFLDTQIAAGLAGLAPSLGYGKLVQALLDVELFKGETRTDWLQRPLSEAQLVYAAEDVAYLVPIHRQLQVRLEELGRYAWALEDSAGLLDPGRYAGDPERAALRLRAAARFDRRQLHAARALAVWRDAEARRRDLPRSFVLKDDLLAQLAARRPQTLRDVQRLPAYDPRRGGRDAGHWLEILRRAGELADDELPPLPWRLADHAAARDAEGPLREIVRQRAAELGVEPELLASRRALEALLRAAWNGGEDGYPEALSGWRRQVVGDELWRTARALRGAGQSTPG
jgi:ribonuclease D